jgi:hypothetical protein
MASIYTFQLMVYGLRGQRGVSVVYRAVEAAHALDNVCVTIQHQCVEVSTVMERAQKLSLAVMIAAQVY